MKQGSEAFQPTPPSNKGPEQKSADILVFPQKTNPLWEAHAKFMARDAEITLSDKTVALYGMLRGEKPDTEKEYQESDQKVLAEALRISGDKDSLDIFRKKYPHIFNPKP